MAENKKKNGNKIKKQDDLSDELKEELNGRWRNWAMIVYPSSAPKDWRKAVKQAERQKRREAERGDHYYRQRTCAVCGKLYWPTHSQQKFCSEDCQRINHNKVTLEFYHRRREQEASA